MTVVATRGNLRLVDDGDGQGHIEGSDVRRPLDSFLKWGYWKPVDEAMTAAAPLPGEEPLAAEYRRFLERYIGKVVRRYRDALTAAGEPNLEQVLDEAGLTEDQRKALKAARDKIAQQAATAQAVQFGISFAVTSPYLQQLVDQHAGKQAERIFEGSRGIVARVIQQSFVEGWSVPQTAAEIKAKLTDAAKWQATMLARTDLIGLANAGSFAAAMSLGEQRPVYKRWINADDEKVRPTHVEAMNQVVPLEQSFLVGHAHLRFPGDPLGPDEEVINCRCTQVYLDDPASIVDHLAASLWFQTTAAGWDESEHPRHPEGTTEGGRFAPKSGAAYSPETAKGAGRFVGNRAIGRISRDLEKVRDQVRQLVAKPSGRPDAAGMSETVYVPNGGFSFTRLMGPDGTDWGWSWNGGPADSYKQGFDTADEAVDDALATLELEQEIAEQNWSKRLKGMVLTKRDAPEVHAFLDAAHAENDAIPRWRALADKWGVGDDEVVLNEPGLASFGKPDVSGFYSPGTGTVFLSGDQLKWKMEPDANPPDLEPGDFAGGTNVAGLLRHEHGHAIWYKMSEAQLNEFRAMVPADKEVRRQLTQYAAGAEEYYGETNLQNDWRGEVMSEVIAVTTHPRYRREDWPGWVNEMGDWVQRQEPPR